MNQTVKEILRAQFLRAYFRDHKTELGRFFCLFCGGVSYTHGEKAKEQPVENLIPRYHMDGCPVAAKIKELEL